MHAGEEARDGLAWWDKLAYPVDMKLIVQVKLLPTDAQRVELLRTMETFNAACNCVAGVAFAERAANRVRLQKKVYGRIRPLACLQAYDFSRG